MRKFLLIGIFIGFSNMSHAGLVQLEASDAGWYNNCGIHEPENTNYIVGYSGAFTCYLSFHNFLVFDLSSVSGKVRSATLELFTYDVVGGLTYNLHEVMTPVDELVAGGNDSIGIYNDLGSGSVWGTTVLEKSNSNQFVQISLNDAAISKLNFETSLFAIGGGYEITNAHIQDYAFGISGHLNNVRLLLDVIPHEVPQPSSLILFGLGLLGLFSVRKRINP